MSIRSSVKRLRVFGTAWLPEQSTRHLQMLREFELGRVTPLLARGARVLEIGAGAGWQAARLAALGFRVDAVDVAESNYSDQRIFPVRLFDGQHLPFEDQAFDCVFSSNVLEHVAYPEVLHREMQRVLCRDGVAVHIVPSGTWSFWTMLVHPVRYWRPARRHGEQARFAAHEILLFSGGRWRRLLEALGWEVVEASASGLFYTGVSLLDHHLSIATRQGLAKYLGSACHVFVLRHHGAASPRCGQTPNESASS